MSRPTSDNAPGQGRVIEGQARSESPDCAEVERKRIATATTRAALIGLALQQLHDGAWLLSYAAFGAAGHVHTLPTLHAVEAALSCFEQAHAEVCGLIDSMRGWR